MVQYTQYTYIHSCLPRPISDIAGHNSDRHPRPNDTTTDLCIEVYI